MIYANVRSIRLAKGISGSHVARGLDVSRQQYYHLETGRTEISAEELNSIAKILDEDITIFFDDKLTKSVLRRIKREVKANGANARRTKGA